MPQSSFLTSGGRLICQFGGRALPVVGTTMAYLNLNDGVKWRTMDIVPDDAREITAARLRHRSKATITADDFGPRIITVSAVYNEAGSNPPFEAAKQQLSQAGEQNLTTDNVTGVLAKLQSFGRPRIIGRVSPFTWQTQMEFFCRIPWAIDLSSTTNPNGIAVSGSSGGTANNFNVTYPGAVFCEPVWTLTIPNTNTQAITQVKLQNTTSGETLIWNGTISASVAHTLIFDTTTFSVTLDGTQQDFTGSYPMLYGPPNQVNAFTLTITAAGATTGLTFSGVWSSRWEF